MVFFFTYFQILEYLFGPASSGGAGLSLLRLPVSMLSDFMVSNPAYTYADDFDYSLSSFSIARDTEFFIPVLREALEINPQLRLESKKDPML